MEWALWSCGASYRTVESALMLWSRLQLTWKMTCSGLQLQVEEIWGMVKVEGEGKSPAPALLWLHALLFGSRLRSNSKFHFNSRLCSSSRVEPGAKLTESRMELQRNPEQLSETGVEPMWSYEYIGSWSGSRL